jgi:coenzyme F420-0:L-glutamate ligase / coenzyme F420-1:gamma-L-glutamate ligase
MNDLHTFLRSRRSIRRFKSEVIPREVVHRLLETAIHAPSAHNLQPWSFLVVESVDARQQLANGIADKYRLDMTADGASETEIQGRVDRTHKRIFEAPVVILLCREVSKVEPQPDQIRQEVETKMAEQSTALAGLQLLLAAHAEGLAGTWICWPLFTSKEIKISLGLAKTWEPEAMFFLGFPAEEAVPKKLESFDELVRFI